MTHREKAAQEQPEYISDKFVGGVLGCPHDIGYCAATGCQGDGETCRKCWDSEIPGTEPKVEVIPQEEVDAWYNAHESGKAEGYEQGLNDAWKLVKKIIGIVDKENHELMPARELTKIYGSNDLLDIFAFSPQEALAKLKAYEDSKIEVGDVVTIFPRAGGEYNAIIVRISSNNYINVFYGDGIVASDIPPELYKKTGKHIDVSSILEQIGEQI